MATAASPKTSSPQSSAKDADKPADKDATAQSPDDMMEPGDTFELISISRPATGEKIVNPMYEGSDSEESINPLDFGPPDMNADQVRRRIRAVVDNGDMLVKDLQDAMDVGAGSYQRFMRQNGPMKGIQSDTFYRAYKFFKEREARGIHDRMKPGAKKKKAAESKDKSSDSADSASKKRKANSSSEDKDTPSKKKSRKDSLNESDNKENEPEMILDGEMEDKVEVYESCDVVRRKIDAHLRKSDVTNAAFCRELSKLYHTQDKKVTSQQLTRFRSSKGADKGNTNPVFYASYVYFEKERLKAKKPKTKHRETMESIWMCKGGFDVTQDRSRMTYIGSANSYMWGPDQYGEYHSARR